MMGQSRAEDDAEADATEQAEQTVKEVQAKAVEEKKPRKLKGKLVLKEAQADTDVKDKPRRPKKKLVLKE